MVAVQRMIDAATKIGGQQLPFRLANARQELRVDHAATLPSARELAEYVQAATGPQPTTQSTSTSLRAMVMEEKKVMSVLGQSQCASSGRVMMDVEKGRLAPMSTRTWI